jgi:MoaA/NifB/PqqE/SkfB family radical SAM enzyme
MGQPHVQPETGRAGGPARIGILQVHPSLRCNLACAHCYSSSGPLAHGELNPDLVCQVVSDVAALGYEVVSLSGGEPLMYRGLPQVLAHAKALGLRTTVTTNGYYARPERLKALSGLIDVLAISLDGPPEVHNAIRGSARAFERLAASLPRVRDAGLAYGFIHTLTQGNWDHLPWVAEFAAENGAGLLQIHPLELAGRARSELAAEAPEAEMLARVYVFAFLLAQQYADTMRVQLDVVAREHLQDEPELVYAGDPGDLPADAPAAQRLGLLVLEPDGAVVPVAFGFDRAYQVCNVKEQRLAEAWPAYLAERYPAFRALCRQTWRELTGSGAPLVSNWHEVIVGRSQLTVAAITD